MNLQKGKLIVFEGVEGSGKTTQIKRSHDWLSNHPIWQQLQAQQGLSEIVVTREPGGTELCRSIRQLLLTPTSQEAIQDRTELLLYAADRAQHVEALLQPALKQGAMILCDRYTDSTVAYQGYGRGFSLELIQQLNWIATGGLEPDLTLWLDLEAEVGLRRTQRRGAADRMEQNDLAFHQRVQQGFAALAAAHSHRIVRISANQSEVEVAEQIQAVLQSYLRKWYNLS